MSGEYDLKKSKETIGQLYPILEAKDGEIIDGFHREEADKNWKRVRLEHIDTEEKKLQARLVANFHRRIVPYSEKKQWINDLAEIYQKQGEKGIAKKISESTGTGYNTILSYLNEEYKDRKGLSMRVLTRPAEPASERLVSLASHHRLHAAEAEKLVEEHREEVLAVEKPKIEQEVKEKLLKSPEFQSEVIREISKPQMESEEEPKTIVNEMVEEYLPAIKEAYENIKPEKTHEPERNKLVLNMLLKNLQQGIVFCPRCGQKMLECSYCHTTLDKMKLDVII